MTVEVIGRACAAPGANSPEELFELMRARVCSVTSIPADRWDIARFWHPEMGVAGKSYTFAAGVLGDIYGFDPALFGISKREAVFMDPQQRLLLEVTWRALEDANIPVAKIQGERVAVFVGASSLDHANLSVEDPAAPGPYFMTGNTLSVVANRISHVFGLNGPSLSVDTACSSSLVALDQAVKALEAGEIDTAIVGGVNVLVHPLPFVGFAQARMLSMDGLCKAYDDDGIGYVRAEGAAALVLRRSDRVRKEGDRSRATIVATGTNAAGRTNGISLPSREAQAELLKAVYDGNGIDPNDVVFIEGHGTGTKVGDPAEVWSLGQVIGKRRRQPIPIGSIKSNIGHTEPASGLLGMIKAMLALENNYLPASLHFEKPNEDIDFEDLNVQVANEPILLEKRDRPRLAGINSFGFGGANAHVVISDPQLSLQQRASDDQGDAPVFLASAHTIESLRGLLEGYSERLKKAPSAAEKSAIVAAAGANRSAMRHRFVMRGSADSVSDTISAYLAGVGRGVAEVGEATTRDPKVALVFSGNGAQWAGMGLEALRRNEVFRTTFSTVSRLFHAYSQVDLLDVLSDPGLAEKLGDTKIAQPLLFAIQVALFDALVALGLDTAAVLGHSVGEVAAAYAAGALTLEDAVTVIAKRSLHQDILAGEGTMAAVKLGEQATLDLIESLGLDGITVAAVNAHNSVTVSGTYEQLKALREKARKRKVAVQPLDINYPFHHPLIDRARDAFLADMPAIFPRSSATAFISTVTGTVLDGASLMPEYWWRNVRQPVKFMHAVEEAIARGCTVFVEVSPRAILGGYIGDIAKNRSASVSIVPTLSRDDNEFDADPVFQSLARAIASGAAFNEERVFGRRNAFVSLPALPFEKVDLRPDRTSDRADIYGRDEEFGYTLAGWRIDPNGASWKNHVDAHLFPDLAEHVVDGRAIMPGSGFIEIALSAARQFYRYDQVEISNLEIVRPLELSRNRLIELSTIISPETGDLEIRSRERLSEDDWSVHVVARSRKLTVAELASTPEIEADGAGVEIDPANAYRIASNFGLDYGPSFQLMAQTVCHGDRLIEVRLKEAAKPAHPSLRYNLNPVSVDAVFHGLVALFDRFSGDHGGAPYIPVRFGAICVAATEKPVRRAIIEIERLSPTSIKAKFHLFDEDGGRVATFEDCRFRRTYLKQRKTLGTLSFHYEVLPAARQTVTSLAGGTSGETLFNDVPESALDNETFLFNAAIFRAMHDLLSIVGQGKQVIAASDLPEDPRLRPFLFNGLHLLTDAGFAEQRDGGWQLASECSLPPVSEILGELYTSAPERTVEAVLINDCYREARERLGAMPESAGEDDGKADRFISDATLEHLTIHSVAARNRADMVVGALQNVLAGDRSSVRILELGSTSPHLTRRLADVAEAKNATLAIYEPDNGLRHRLELAFENDPRVTLLDRLETELAADVIVSASDRLRELIENDVAKFASDWQTGSAVLLAAVNAPGVFQDFVYGLSNGWFSRSRSEEFPVGSLPSATEWSEILEQIGYTHADVRQRDMTGGSAILIEARGRRVVSGEAVAETSAVVEPFRPVVMVHGRGIESGTLTEVARTAGFSRMQAFAASGNLDLDKAAFLDVFSRDGGATEKIVFLSPRHLQAEDASRELQHRVLVLSALALAQAEYRNGTAQAQKLRLIVVAPGGAPAGGSSAARPADPVNSGLWVFLRVLRNEFDFLDVECVDPTGGTDNLKVLLEAAHRVSESTGRNREWCIEADGTFCEIRAVPGAAPRAFGVTSDFTAAVIRQQVPSQVASIRWESCDLPTIGPDEVLVEVAATGLNFRDVMWAMGLLPEEALEDGFAGASIGMEFSGRVVRTGDTVDDLSVGDPVMAIAASAFSTHVAVKRTGVAKLPAGIDPVAAASIPVVFLTAYYAIVELGRARPGETILIHGAAGGVGLAALQVAKHAGIKVIATAGTEEKRRFVEMLGADHVFDSRTLSFVGDVLNVTGGEGVDLVLNSLFGEAMEKSLSLVKPFGRFLELGKRDYYSDSKIGLRPFRRNVSYFGIDADQLLVLHPDLSRRMLTEIGALFDEGVFSPLPYRAFDHDEIGDAFRLMQNAGHIGKIVVLPPKDGIDHVAAKAPRTMKVDPQGAHLVVGGIGGFGLVAAEWLVEKGARTIALCSRRGTADEATAAAISRWTQSGVDVRLFACDVTRESDVKAMLADLRRAAPLKTVIHAAMILDDALIGNLTEERNRPVIDVKAKGAAILDAETRVDVLDNFILFSSVTTLVGNPGQANYVAANGFLEGLARARRAEGLPALAVGFGAIADAGYLARNADVGQRLDRRLGKTAINARDALNAVEEYIGSAPDTVDAAVVMISEFDWAAAHNLAVVNEALFDVVMRKAAHHASGTEGGDIDLVAMIEGKSPAEAQDVLFDILASEIATILRVSRESILKESVLKDIGLDSLMAVELGLNFEQNTGFDMPLSSLADNATVGDITRRLYEKVKARNGAEETDADVSAETRIVDELSRRHAGAE
ncbi:type I polyketide synthase [Ciceribacter thiooxidans]|uniref:Type I polyketide synthase n=1 Tax=Ciceribacter thiooxidans TaxID=1969821 RepID=A0ABV7I050_9HYPH|nr:type I polyketide synthase [Ciceribacter thiooxidans]